MSQPSLFAHLQKPPLAARMRPRTLDEFIGQEAILGPGRLLRRAIQADQLSSVIFYGPPGTGKTTLAQIVANTTQAQFLAINAVLDGIKEIRQAVEQAQFQQQNYGRKTLLFVDEVHRFNKAQQDALLPWVENGTVIMIGATTENPYFEVNKALISRSRLFQLKPLGETELQAIAEQALTDPQRGYGRLAVRVAPEALRHLVHVSNGDARSLLNALELAVETTAPDPEGHISVTLAVAEESIQRRAVLYDKEGDAHYDTISAFIKSLRGSDPDAALYWLARMIYAGEDPRFIFRRMVILAGEDVGLADPQAMVVVNACAAAFDRVGMPEGQYPMAQAALYLATAPKSNSVMGYFDALAAVQKTREGEVPNPLKDSSRDQQGFGHGSGYRYPHAYRDHWVAQQYLPGNLQGQVFYQPSNQGYELQIRDAVARRREEQLAALQEEAWMPTVEILSYSPSLRSQERWLQRTLSQVGSQLGHLRDLMFEWAKVQRHHRVLDLNGGNGLLLWEAIRQTPEGGLTVRVGSAAEAQSLREQAQSLEALNRPDIVQVELAELPQRLAPHPFDRILGYNALIRETDKWATVLGILTLLDPEEGVAVLAETQVQLTQRLYRLVDPAEVGEALFQEWVEAEEAIYDPSRDPMMQGSLPELAEGLVSLGWRVESKTHAWVSDRVVTPQLWERWFLPGTTRPSYVDHLEKRLKPEGIQKIKDLWRQKLNQSIAWQQQVGILRIRGCGPHSSVSSQTSPT